MVCLFSNVVLYSLLSELGDDTAADRLWQQSETGNEPILGRYTVARSDAEYIHAEDLLRTRQIDWRAMSCEWTYWRARGATMQLADGLE